MAGVDGSVPCRYITAEFDLQTFVNARREEATHSRDEALCAFFTEEVVANIRLINALFCTDDPEEKDYIRMSLTGKDRGIPLRDNPTNLPFVLIDPKSFFTVHVTYWIDPPSSSERCIADSFTLHPKTCPPGSCISVTLRGCAATLIKPIFLSEKPGLGSLPETIHPTESGERAEGMGASIVRTTLAASQYLDPRQLCHIQ